MRSIEKSVIEGKKYLHFYVWPLKKVHALDDFIHRQSIIFFSRLLFLQQVTKCHILWRISISLPWIEHILISMVAATTDKSQSICFILFIYFLRKPFLSITTCRKKKIWFPSEQEIKRYDHSMTSLAWIFQWYFRDT